MGCAGAKEVSQADKTAIKARGSMYFGQKDDGRDPTELPEAPHGLSLEERHRQLHSQLEEALKAGSIEGIVQVLMLFSRENLKIVPPAGSNISMEQIEACLASISSVNIAEVQCPHCNALNICVSHPAQCVCGKCNQRFEHPMVADIKVGLARKCESWKETGEKLGFVLVGRDLERAKEIEKRRRSRCTQNRNDVV